MTDGNDTARRFHKPDRSNYVPNLTKTSEDEHIDIGWAEGTMGDGRPYRAESWAGDGTTSVTFYFSTAGLETLSKERCAELLVREGLIRFTGDRRYVVHVPLEDASGQPVWAASVLLAAGENVFAEDQVRLLPYARRSPVWLGKSKTLEYLVTEEDYERHGMKPMVFVPLPKRSAETKPSETDDSP